MSRTRKLRVKLPGYSATTKITATFVNPGEWFKKRWLVGVGAGFSCLFYIIEGDCEQDVLDVLVDSEWGHIVKTDCDHDEPAGPLDTNDCTFAGNYSEHVDFDDIRVLERIGA